MAAAITMANKRYIHLRPRLAAVFDLLRGHETIADIGCDHGRLGLALLQYGGVKKVIATDVSAPSLKKAQALASYVGLFDRMDFRVGDGLSVLDAGEANAIAICGMGGKLIAELLQDVPIPLMGANVAALAPMRGVEELRLYLRSSGYRILCERMVYDQKRYYPVLLIEQGMEPPLPAGWPKDFMLLGPKALEEESLGAYLNQAIERIEINLKTAKNSRGETMLAEQLLWLRQILQLWEEKHAAE